MADETQQELLRRLQNMTPAEAAAEFLILHQQGNLIADFNQDGRVTVADWSAMLAGIGKEPGWIQPDEDGHRKFLITGLQSDRNSPDADITRCYDFEEALRRSSADWWRSVGCVYAFEAGAIHELPRQIRPASPSMILRPMDITKPAMVRTADSEHGMNFVSTGERRASLSLLHLAPSSDTPDGAGIRVVGSWHQVGIIGCSLLGFDTPILVQGDTVDPIGPVTIHRNVTEVGTRRSHAQNVYVARAASLAFTENFLLNPLNRGSNRGEGTIFGHGGYFQANIGHVTAIGNLVESAQSHGLQVRPGGRIEHNLFLDCPIGLLVGNHHKDQQAVESTLYRNFALYCGDIQPESYDPEGRFRRGTGFYFEGVRATARQCAAIYPTTRRDQARAFELTEDRGADVTLQECGSYGYEHLVRTEGSDDHVCRIEAAPAWSTTEAVVKNGMVYGSGRASSHAVEFPGSSDELLGERWYNKVRQAHYGAWPIELTAQHIINRKIVPAFYRTA